MEYTDHFKAVTKERLIQLVLGGAVAGIALDIVLFILKIPDMMPFILLGIIIILLLSLLDWLDLHLEIFSRP